MFVFLFIASSSFIHVFVCSIETLHLITHSSVQLLPPCCERGTRYTTSIRVLSLHIQRITTVSLYYVSCSTHPLLNSAKLGTRYNWFRGCYTGWRSELGLRFSQLDATLYHPPTISY